MKERKTMRAAKGLYYILRSKKLLRSYPMEKRYVQEAAKKTAKLQNCKTAKSNGQKPRSCGW
jgi:hypothetical protein